MAKWFLSFASKNISSQIVSAVMSVVYYLYAWPEQTTWLKFSVVHLERLNV